MRRLRIWVPLAMLALLTAGLVAHGPDVDTEWAEANDASIIPLPDGQSTPAGWVPVPRPIPPSTCGGNVCGPGTYCCNPSCGTCTPFGAYCTQQVCAPTS